MHKKLLATQHNTTQTFQTRNENPSQILIKQQDSNYKWIYTQALWPPGSKCKISLKILKFENGFQILQKGVNEGLYQSSYKTGFSGSDVIKIGSRRANRFKRGSESRIGMFLFVLELHLNVHRWKNVYCPLESYFPNDKS